jgi:general secretion pathway protein B
MSYILDALRKSEQQRQATQPNSVTDRILVNPTQPKQKPTKWIIALVFINLLVVTYLVWFFTKKSEIQLEHSTKIASNPEQKILPENTEKQPIQPTVIAQNRISPETAGVEQPKTSPASPSIADLVEAKKKATIQPINPKPVVEKKIIAVKKEPVTRAMESEPMGLDIPEPIQEIPLALPKNQGTPGFNELPYEVRNNLPNLTINVFSYAQDPKDRFVIIDMVKYRTGQLIKGTVKLREIRPDSILVEYGNNTFSVERP